MHGGKGSGAPKGKANGRFRHGLYTDANKGEIACVRELMREFNQFAKEI
ncbi:hypothetical protein GCM10011273_02890 [Asticcacaulis endophyticus]|uniref:Uncharacterized protein n=2 Tax=Asticcacaulis endophyticus TaxID=1395890 RepID=A0A918PUD1_9CAUL|nr:hypothetical protein GCM10011273_02890 [Asticcacaulis endophyticus]